MIKRVSKRLDTRLALYLAVALVTLLAVFILTTLRFQERLIQAQVQQDILNTTKSFGEGIEYMLEARISAIEYLVQDITEQGFELSLYSSTRRSLQGLFDSFWLVDNDSTVLEKWPSTLADEAITQNVVTISNQANRASNNSRSQSVFISEPRLNPMGEGKPIIQLALPIQSGDHSYGVFVGNVSLEQQHLLNRMKPLTIGASGFLALSSATGAIIFHPLLEEPLGEIPDYQEALITTTLGHNKVGQVIHEHEGVFWMQTFYRVDGANWVLAAVLPVAEAMQPLKDLRWVLIKISIIVTLVIIVLVFFIVQLKLKPLRTMREELALVQKSKLNHINLAGSIELDELAKSFNQLLKSNAIQTKQAQQRQAYLDMVLSSSSVGHFMTDSRGMVEYINDALVQITGLSREQLLHGDLQAQLPDTNQVNLAEWFTETIKKQQERAIEFQYIAEDNKLIWLKVAMKPVIDHGICLGHVGTVTDVTSQKKELESLRSKVNLDELTGLMNRRGIEQVMNRAWNEARLFNRQLTIMALDLDHFKEVNDQHGHEQGDWVLKEAAKLFMNSVRDSDWVARLGGDEFIIVLPQCPHSRAVAIAENIISKMRAISAERELAKVTVSIGIAEMAPGDQSQLDTLRRADKAAYEAKHEGRNRWAAASST